MKKGQYYITISAGKGKRAFKQVDGYIETINGVELGFRKNNGVWGVTDVKTGLALGVLGKSRKEALEEAIPLLPSIKEAHDWFSTKALIEELKNCTEV